MILEITGTDGLEVKIRNVVSVGQLMSHPDQLYYLQINKRKGKATCHEIFVPFEKIKHWVLR